MRKIWEGQKIADNIGAIGPSPVSKNGPELLIGGSDPKALQRVARWGNGYISGGGGPEAARKNYDQVSAFWNEAGRGGKPRFVSGLYFALGPDAQEAANHYINHYYSFIGPVAARLAASVPTNPQALKQTIEAFAAAGLDEVVLWPCVADLSRVDYAAQLDLF